MQCKTSDKRGTESEGGYKFLQFFSFGNHLVLSLSFLLLHQILLLRYGVVYCRD